MATSASNQNIFRRGKTSDKYWRVYLRKTASTSFYKAANMLSNRDVSAPKLFGLRLSDTNDIKWGRPSSAKTRRRWNRRGPISTVHVLTSSYHLESHSLGQKSHRSSDPYYSNKWSFTLIWSHKTASNSTLPHSCRSKNNGGQTFERIYCSLCSALPDTAAGWFGRIRSHGFVVLSRTIPFSNNCFSFFVFNSAFPFPFPNLQLPFSKFSMTFWLVSVFQG